LGFGAWDLGFTKKPIIEIGIFVVAPRLRRAGLPPA
jgi:hypothetical protein